MDSLDYLGYLARTVPPRRLAQAAALRLWRGARRPLNRAIGAPSAAEVLAAHGARTPRSLVRRLEAAVAGRFAFASPEGAADAAAAIARELPLEAEAALALAEEARAGVVRIFGRRVRRPRAPRAVPYASAGWSAIDWERDPRGGLRFDGGRIPAGGDPKLPWAAGRLEEAVHLACGARLSAERAGTRAFADAAIDLLLDFAAAPRGIQWTCAMEVALRAANVAIALRLLLGLPAAAERPEALLELLRSLSFHVAWVEAHPEDGVAVPNNHLVADLVGPMVVGALFPLLPGTRAAALRAARRLPRELMAQTLADGLSFEGSVPYHRLAVELFALGDLAADALGRPLGPEQRARLADMFAACAALLDGRGLAPQIGDNDSGRALPFRPREPQEQAYLLPLGAALTGRSELRVAAPSAEALWLLGREAARPPGPRGRSDAALRHGGVFVLRSRRTSVAIACGGNGTGGTGCHGHNDKLAIEVCVDGRLVIADPGSGSYTGDPALRNRLRGTAAHSTVVVDGQEQQPLPAGRLFALPDAARATCLSFESAPERARFVGEHHGYDRLPQPAIHRREVSLDKRQELLVVTDRILGAGSHLAEVRFLLPFTTARVRAPTESERARLAEAAPGVDPWRGHAVELGPEAAPYAVLVGAGAIAAPELEPAIYSRGYGELGDALSACFPIAGGAPLVFTAALLPGGGAAAGRREGGG